MLLKCDLGHYHVALTLKCELLAKCENPNIIIHGDRILGKYWVGCVGVTFIAGMKKRKYEDPHGYRPSLHTQRQN